MKSLFRLRSRVPEPRQFSEKFLRSDGMKSFSSFAVTQRQLDQGHKSEYLMDLRDRLDQSWAAGLESQFPEAMNLVLKDEVMDVLEESVKLLSQERNVVDVNLVGSTDVEDNNDTQTLTVVGDTHGQFYDLLNILDANGMPSKTNKYIFNGDFVDRGSFSFQTVFLLLAMKVLQPNSVFLTRGNHETPEMNSRYGFTHEIAAKYDRDVLLEFWNVFANLPLGCVINNSKFPDFRTMVIHGGLFTDSGVTIDEINGVNRVTALDSDPSSREQRIVTDALWSDPSEFNGRSESARGAGIQFGPDVTREFLDDNDLSLIIRSHEVRAHGWSLEQDSQLVTLFSAPNYCDQGGNKGAWIKFSSDAAEPTVFEFDASLHPPLDPMHHMSLRPKL